MPLFLAAATFLIALILLAGSANMLTRRQGPDVAGRLESLARTEARKRADRPAGLLRDGLLSAVPLINRLLTRWSWSHRLQVFLDQAGWKIRPGKLLLISGVTALFAVMLADIFTSLPAALLFGLAAGAVPLLFASFRRARRLREFQRQFPEAIDLLTRAVRAGHGLNTGMEMISGEFRNPLAGEFRSTFDEQNLGMPLRDALLHLIERVPIADVRFFVSALLIQKESGGNLAEILETLAAVIRDRFRLQGEVRVRTAQGRLTAGILIALPIALFLLLYGINREYISVLIHDSIGRHLLAVAASLQVIGSALLWKIVHIEI